MVMGKYVAFYATYLPIFAFAVNSDTIESQPHLHRVTFIHFPFIAMKYKTDLSDKEKEKRREKILSAIAKLKKVQDVINERALERANETEGILLAILTGTSCLFIGEPGTGKTQQIRIACQLLQMSVFDTLISETTKPDSIFGPPDIPALAKGIQRNKLKGYAPDSEVLFFDEIFKASGIVLNPLLWLINEHQFRNGDEGIVKCPTVAVFAASNEIPTEVGLKPIYDRFLLRYHVRYLRNRENMNRMLELDDSPLPDVGLTRADVDLLRRTVRMINIPDDVREAVFALRDIVHRSANVVISDRRMVKSFRILQAYALMHKRSTVKISDISVLANVFWDELEQISRVRSLVLNTSNASLSDLMSYEELAESLWQRATKTGDMDEIEVRLKEMWTALSKHTTGEGVKIAERINDYIQRVRAIKERRNDFIVMELKNAEGKFWYKLSASCETFWTPKQLRMVKFRHSRKYGYWWKEGPKKANALKEFRLKFAALIQKKLGVKASFTKML